MSDLESRVVRVESRVDGIDDALISHAENVRTINAKLDTISAGVTALQLKIAEMPKCPQPGLCIDVQRIAARHDAELLERAKDIAELKTDMSERRGAKQTAFAIASIVVTLVGGVWALITWLISHGAKP